MYHRCEIFRVSTPGCRHLRSLSLGLSNLDDFCSVKGGHVGASLSKWLTSSTSTLFSFLRIALGLLNTKCSFSAVSWISCNFRMLNEIADLWSVIDITLWYTAICIFLLYPQYFIWWWNSMWNCSVNLLLEMLLYSTVYYKNGGIVLLPRKGRFWSTYSIPKLVLPIVHFLDSNVEAV